MLNKVIRDIHSTFACQGSHVHNECGTYVHDACVYVHDANEHVYT